MKKIKVLLAVLVCFAIISGLVGCKNNEVQGQTVRVNISCEKVLGYDEYKDKIKEPIPANGIISDNIEITVPQGASVMDAMILVAQNKGIEIDYSLGYISAIAGLKAMECGPMSGWLYTVNGEMPMVGASDLKLQQDDQISFDYSVEFEEE